MSSGPIIRQVRAGTPFEYYPLSTKQGFALLSDEQEIVLNKQSGYMALMDWGYRQFIVDTILLPHEIPLIKLLLDKWPAYVPYRYLLPLATTEPGDIDTVHDVQRLAPIHETLAACNERLRFLGLQCTETAGNGYRITASPDRIIEEKP
jgi:hypothetical protein